MFIPLRKARTLVLLLGYFFNDYEIWVDSYEIKGNQLLQFAKMNAKPRKTGAANLRIKIEN